MNPKESIRTKAGDHDYAPGENFFTSRNNQMVIYIASRILWAMKEQLGLEAMLEYLAKYIEMVNTHNPIVKEAVTQAVQLMDVKKMYEKGCS